MANTTGKKFGGRTKGTPNKDTKALRERIESLLDERWDGFLEDLDRLSEKERVDTIVRLMEYALPKLNRTEVQPVEPKGRFVGITFLDSPDDDPDYPINEE